MCETQPTRVVPAADTGAAEGGTGVVGPASSSSRASPTGRVQPKHPYGRRNTYIGTYIRHGLGYCTVGRDETLTKTKFRDLSSRERRLYTLTLGYGLREDGNSVRRQRKPEMGRGHAVALMARLQEMMLHEGRTVEGIFAALGLDDTSHTNVEQYKTALEHISVRAGTAIPTGAAEGALAALYQQREEAWPFLAEHLVSDGARREESRSPKTSGTQANGTEDGKGDVGGEGERRVASETDGATTSTNDKAERHEKRGGVGKHQQPTGHARETKRGGSSTTSSGDALLPESVSLLRLSAAIEAFACTRQDRSSALEGLAVQDLMNFLYLGGQAKLSLEELKAIVEKYGRWAVERVRRDAKDQKAKLTEATRSAAAGKAFALSDKQLDAAVDFLDPNQDGNIDLEELMHALKQERTAKKVLSKGKHGPEQRQDLAEKDKPGSGGVASDGDNGDDGHKEPAESSEDNVSATKGSRSNGSVGAEELEGAGEGGESSSRAEETVNDTSAAEQRQKLQDDKKERPLFSLEEAESLTAYLVESQQAFSLINVADIQRGLRSAKRAEAQAASRDVYRRAAERFADELRTVGVVLESDEGWARWFDMCELGLRAGEAGTKRLVGRNELRRGLKALSGALTEAASPAEAAPDGGEGDDDGQEGEKEAEEAELAADADAKLPAGRGRRGGGWSEQEVDDLLSGVKILGSDARGGGGGSGSDGGGRGGYEADLADVEFRERLMAAIGDGGARVDRHMAAAQEVLPLAEKLEAYLKDNGMRLGQLFERMVAWAKSALEEDLIQRPEPSAGASPRPGARGVAGGGAQRGDDSCVAPAALKAVLASLKTGGMTGAEKARIKAEKRLAAKDAEDRKAAEGMSAEAAKRLAEAEKSGASIVLALLRASVASKSIRVIELFNAMDTSKDGLISREELRAGLSVIAEGHLGQTSSVEQMREEYKKRKLSAAIRDSQEKERRQAIKLRARIAATEGSGAAKVLRRIHEHLVQTGRKVVDLFHSFSLRGNLSLTAAELEMALSLVDGLEVTRREVRSVVRFLDKDSNGTIDVSEIDKAVREFRELVRDTPSLGTGPMTVIDPVEIDRLARRTFADLAAKHPSSGKGDEIADTEADATTTTNSDKNDGNKKREGDDVEVLPEPAAGALPDTGQGLTEGETSKGDVDSGGEQQPQQTVSVSEISAAFAEALRQFKAEGEGEHSIGAMRRPGIQQPSTDTQHAKACVDKVMEWLRSSRSFDRAPTGRVPTLKDQMTERQKMELELQNKLQEKRRREAGQRHWEEWVSRKARRCQTARPHGDVEKGRNPGVGGGGGNEQQRQRQEEEDKRRKKEQDEAFAAWARQKDKLLRARRREKRRALTAGGLNSLEAINKTLQKARGANQSRFLPRLGSRSDGAAPSGGGGGSLTTSGWSKDNSKDGGRSKAPTKAGLKALDLAVTRVAVSPYRVRARDKYQHSKHIEGGEIVTRMARSRITPFPKALVKEGWQATSQLLGSASMSRIDHPTAKQVAAGGRNVGEKGWKRGDGRLPGQRSAGDTGSASDRSRRRAVSTKRSKRRGSARKHLHPHQEQEREWRPAYRPLASPDNAVAASQRASDAPTAVIAAQTNISGGRHSMSFVPPHSSSEPQAATDLDRAVDAEAPRIEQKEGGDELRGEAAAAAAATARPDGRRGNSRGGPEGTGGLGLEGTARDFQRPPGEETESRRGSSNSDDMEFPVHSQALPDWADTIKDLPVDDPYEEGEDDFEPDDESTPPSVS